MNVESCSLPAMISLFHEDNVGDGGSCQHPNDTEPQVKTNIFIMIIEVFELVVCIRSRIRPSTTMRCRTHGEPALPVRLDTGCFVGLLEWLSKVTVGMYKRDRQKWPKTRAHYPVSSTNVARFQYSAHFDPL